MRSISANDPRQNLLRTVVASSSLKLQIRTILGFRHPTISIKKELPWTMRTLPYKLHSDVCFPHRATYRTSPKR